MTPEERIAALEAENASLRAQLEDIPEMLRRGIGSSESYPKAAKTDEEMRRAAELVSAMKHSGCAVYTKREDGTYEFVRFATQEEDDAFATLFHTVLLASDRYRDEAQENLDLANAATDIANGLIEAFKLCEASFERHAERKRSKMRGQSQQAALKGFATAGVWSAAAEELKTVVGRKMREAASAALDRRSELCIACCDGYHADEHTSLDVTSGDCACCPHRRANGSLCQKPQNRIRLFLLRHHTLTVRRTNDQSAHLG